MHIYGYRFRNIGPFSNIWTSISFEDKAQLKMLIGDNGIGKSTTIKVLKFGSYHDLAYHGDVKADEIANDINKNGEIEIDINSKGKDWTICTSFSPNRIRLYEGCGEKRADKPLDKGGMPETKRYIRDHVLDVPFYIFDNILSLDVTEFKSLLTLNAEDTRKIRDRIFGFSVFNTMSDEIRKELNKHIDLRKETELLINTKTTQRQELLDGIKSIQEQISGKATIEDINVKLQQVTTERDDKSIKFGFLERDLELAKETIKWHENSDNQKIIDEKVAQVRKLRDQIIALNTEQDEIDKKIKAITDYATYKTLLNSIDADTKTYKEKAVNIAEYKKQYDAFTASHKEVSASKEAIAISKQTRELKTTYLNLLETTKIIELDEKRIAEESQKLDAAKSELSIVVHAIAANEKKLVAMKAGKCTECGTEFNHPDHGFHVRDLEKNLELAKANRESLNTNILNLTRDIRLVTDDLQSQKSKKAVLDDKIKNNPFKWSLEDIRLVDTSNLAPETDLPAIDAKLEGLRIEANKVKDAANQAKGICASLKEKIDANKTKLAATPNMAFPEGNVDELQKRRAEVVAERHKKQIEENDTEVQRQVLASKMHKHVWSDDPLPFTKVDAEDACKTFPVEIEKMDKELDELNKKIFEYEKSIELIKNAADLDIQSSHLKKTLSGVEVELSGYDASMNQLKLDIERAEYKLEIIKLSKEEVLRVYMPYVNHAVVSVCKKIGVKQRLVFDDSFTARLYRGNREVSIGSASVGQRKKMNFAVLIAITKLLKLKYGGLNIIFYDEMFSSIDEKSRPQMLEIIRQEIVENLNMHVWITNHFFIPNSNFDGYMVIEEKSGFSQSRVVEDLLTLEETHRERQTVEV